MQINLNDVRCANIQVSTTTVGYPLHKPSGTCPKATRMNDENFRANPQTLARPHRLHLVHLNGESCATLGISPETFPLRSISHKHTHTSKDRSRPSELQPIMSTHFNVDPVYHNVMPSVRTLKNKLHNEFQVSHQIFRSGIRNGGENRTFQSVTSAQNCDW